MSKELQALEDEDGYNEDVSIMLEAGACPPCAVGYHWECEHQQEDTLCCCIPNRTHIGNDQPDSESDSSGGETPKQRGGQVKDYADITDVQSTGRKRAAQMYPITEGMVCEWAQLKSAGGGVVSIIGCNGNVATDRHHGPDKNTLNNTEGNVHRICATCHNRWHAANDQYYGTRPEGTSPFIPLDGHNWGPHDGDTKAILKEIIEADIAWSVRKDKRKREKNNGNSADS